MPCLLGADLEFVAHQPDAGDLPAQSAPSCAASASACDRCIRATSGDSGLKTSATKMNGRGRA